MPYWMWIGNNSTQYNATPASNLAAAELNSIVGYKATGGAEVSPVMVNGQIIGGNFQPTFNPTYGINGQPSAQFPDGGPYGGSDMSYTSDDTGAVTNTQITSAVTAGFRITDLDASGNEYVIGTYTGIFAQMANGDVFFRPALSYVNDWSNITRIHGIEVVSATAIPNTTPLNPVIGFNPDIVDIEIVPCFTRGTAIMTPDGFVMIEDLRVGDLVMTKDRGPQPIRWIGRRVLGAATLTALPHLRPVRIATGALGDNTPSSDLLVSPQHRILVRSAIAQRMFGAPEVLSAAKQLLQLDGVDVEMDVQEVEYLHILFDQHEIVMSNGAETESLYTGKEALKSIGAAARDEIFALFPDLAEDDNQPLPARPLASGRMARKIAIRHQQNGKPLVAA